MFIIVDVVIVVLFLLCIFLGYKRGLTRCLINVLSFFIAVAIAAVLFKPVAGLINDNTQIDENLQTSIVNLFEQEESKEEDKKEDSSSPITQYITEKIKDATEEKKNEIVNNTAKELALKIIEIISFIGIFVLVRIALIFVKAIADLITKLPIIKQCDKIGGVIYGVLQFLVLVFIGLALITFVSTMINQYTLLELINKSYIGSILNNNNILIKLIF